MTVLRPAWPADSYIFDLDGTLVDSASDIAHAASLTLARYGRRGLSREETIRFIGDGARKLVERAFEATGEALSGRELDRALGAFLEIYEVEPGEHTRPFPGVVSVLDALHEARVPMVICTNKPEGIARDLLVALGLDGHFREVIGGDTLPVAKPDPAPVLAALATLGPVRAPWYVGDSPTDRKAAANAGLPCVLVRWGYTRIPVDELGAERVFDDLAPLLAATTGA